MSKVKVQRLKDGRDRITLTGSGMWSMLHSPNHAAEIEKRDRRITALKKRLNKERQNEPN